MGHPEYMAEYIAMWRERRRRERMERLRVAAAMTVYVLGSLGLLLAGWAQW